MTFGKNRVQFNDFYWEYYRFKRYDTYFYLSGKNLARYTSKVIDEELKHFENFFSHNLNRRIIFLIYNKHSEFKQSNIGLVSGNEETNIGGTTRIIDNKVFIFYEGDHPKFVKQIRAAIAEVVLIDMLYGGNLKQKVSSSALLSLPDWFYFGLVSYLSEDWSVEQDNLTKDMLERGKLKKINQLTDQEAVVAGHAIWSFIVKYYGEAVISNIIYLTRVNKNPESGFLYVLGADMKSLSYMWLDYYEKRYEGDGVGGKEPEKEKIIFKPKKKRAYQHVKLSPDKRYIAFTTNYSGKRKVWIYDTETEKNKKIIRLEHRLYQLVDYSYPIISWHPSGKILAFIAEEKGKIVMSFYFPETGEIKKRNMPYFDKILDFSYSDRGMDMVFSAIMNGQTDIFVYNLSAGASKKITNDVADDLYPRFIENSSKIIFSSNRLSDTITVDNTIKPKISPTYDLFVYDRETKSTVLTNVTNTSLVNEISPIGIKNNTYSYLSDKNGIYNRYLATFDSTISFIDTTTHYRYYTTQFPQTNRKRNIASYDISTGQNSSTEIMYYYGQDKMYNYIDEQDISSNKLKETVYRKDKIKWYRKQDSLKLVEKQKIIKKQELRDSLARNNSIPHPDTMLIDINYYVFEKEKEHPHHIVYGTDSLDFQTENDSLTWPEQKIYLTSFYPDQMVTQIDFGFLNDSYQAFVPGAYYFNPGFNIFTKIGINDLFEDYRLTGGFRFAGDFNSFEYLLSVEDLKNRWDKQYIYHRLSVINTTNGFVPFRLITNELKFRLSYPFNQVSSIRGMLSMRSDRAVLLSYYTNSSLTEEDQYRFLGGVKLEYIFDNTIERGINLYNGTRFKIFGEYYKGISPTTEDTYILGADFRFYQPIHRSLIFAGRIATSASFGTGKLIYYLGSVDNWMNWSQDIPTFDQSVRIDPEENYIFQAVATDMRGFVQNARNGTNFVLGNAEIRWPVVQYLANRTLNSSFLNNFQVVGFADIGSAWSGLHPWEDNNAYNTEIIENNPIRIIITKNRSPFIVGYGFGLRSKLLGYFVRADWAWGIDGNVILPRVFYFSLSLDF
jgi:Tol biopolymer transport system component